MTYVDWEFKAREFVNCNCDYGCPCQFSAQPTRIPTGKPNTSDWNGA